VIPRSQRAPCELISHRVQLGACAQKDSPTASHGTGCRERGRMRRSTEYGSFAGAHGCGYPIVQLPSAELRIFHVHSFNQPQSEAVRRSSASCRHTCRHGHSFEPSSYEPVPFMQLRGLCWTHGGLLQSPSRTLYLAFVPRPIRKYPAIVTVMRVPLGTNRSLHQLFRR
jgi:hypothetical protein